MIKINNTAIKTPSNYEFQLSDIDGSTERSANGTMYRDRIAVKRKLNIEWGPMNRAEMSVLLKAMQNEFFTVTYPDALTGKNETKTFYVGDRNTPMYNFKLDLWNGLKANFIEK